MTSPADLYTPSLALLTDLYQLTMAYGYWKLGLAEREAVFHLTYRRDPFGGDHAIAAGLEPAMGYLQSARFGAAETDYLATLTGNDGAPLFERAFLDFLVETPPQLDVDAIVEGTLVFPHEPLVRVKGPLYQAQIAETALLTIINFHTLVATKASRICRAARGEPVLEFGLRRAQGIDGGLAASRAAYIGGCVATSNVLAGRLHGIPVKGTHAHAWVMVFGDEIEAFESYASAMPNNCVFLVDTYDTVQGVHRAVEVGRRLRARGYEMVGVRLDSGDLAELSIAARRILDDGGFPDASVVASNDLDEYRIAELKKRGATIGVWGVGTRLATCHDQPALGGVYKLAAIRDEHGRWEPRIKLSNTPIKVSNPGIQQVRRYRSPEGTPLADVIVDELTPPGTLLVPHNAPSTVVPLPDEAYDTLLVPVLRAGQAVYTPPPLSTVREHTLRELDRFAPALDSGYPVGLESGLAACKETLIAAAAVHRPEGTIP